MLVTSFDFELVDVVKARDIDFSADCFLGEVASSSLGVHVRVQQLQS